MQKTDIAIIGGGASGLAAAVEAGRMGGGYSICIVERLPRVGKKLLATGNGRCNLGNINATAESYMGGRDLISSVLSHSGDTINFFRELGLHVRADTEGRLYPMSNSAASVLDSLRLRARSLGISEVCGFRVTELDKMEEGFILTSETGAKISAKRVIFAAGGSAAPQMGTDGSAFELLRKLGHSTSVLKPALAPLFCTSKELKSLKGVRINAKAAALCKGEFLGAETGEIQFTDDYISGICVFDLAALEPDELSVDLLPEHSIEQTNELINELADKRAGAVWEELLTGLFPKRVGQALLKRCGIAFMNPITNNSPDLSRLVGLIKDWRFKVSSPGMEKAQATLGGIPAGELTCCLESKMVPGIYIAGEAVDVLGPCGGYNLNWAWVSGRCAGTAAVESLT